jgi:hypothetical protein
MSRGTAKSAMNIGLPARARHARSTILSPNIGLGLAVQETTMSKYFNCSGSSASGIARAQIRRATRVARSGVRLATTS